MIEQVIFDVDLTLLNSFGWVLARYQEVARRMYLNQPQENHLKGMWGMKIPDIIGGLWPEIEFNKIMPVVMAVSRESSPPLIAGVIETLGQIYQSDLALGLLSTTPRDIFEHQLTAAGVKLELFEKIIGGSDTSFRKPDPKVFEVFTEVRRADSLVYVGDALVDWEAARDADLGLFLGVTTGFTSKQDFLSAGVPEIQILDSVVNVPKALALTD
ncbi:MAG: HAD hydrolase-like protein [Patescibacteria group bacterium]